MTEFSSNQSWTGGRKASRILLSPRIYGISWVAGLGLLLCWLLKFSSFLSLYKILYLGFQIKVSLLMILSEPRQKEKLISLQKASPERHVAKRNWQDIKQLYPSNLFKDFKAHIYLFFRTNFYTFFQIKKDHHVNSKIVTACNRKVVTIQYQNCLEKKKINQN